ncbi:MAG: alpha-amylase family glycosyl hydrolase [Gammaproteobacteria bacterium]
MNQTKYPSLYQINTREWLTELSQDLGRPATLDDISDAELDRLADMGFDWIWFLSVWTTGEKGRKVSLENPEWRHEFEQTLRDLKEEDIGGSGFAIADYHVHPDLGGDKALKRLRAKLHKSGLRLMLDFVPNHMGPDHSWVEEHPEYFVPGTESDLERSPQNYFRLKSRSGERILAYGRDPYFSGWPDTVQVDYSNPDTVAAMKQELVRIAGQCDGVRCDMAMLILPDVFERTWGRRAIEFWPGAMEVVRKVNADFCFMAEVYWDMEWTLQQQGFSYTYDKRLYDRLLEGNTRSIREHFYAGLGYQEKLARFLENHDEPRAATAFQPDKHRAAAIITFLLPGLRFFHQGQFEERTKRISPHLIRAPKEPIGKETLAFYADLLSVLKQTLFNTSQWSLLECVPAWDGNESWNSFMAFSWVDQAGKRALVVVNYAPHQAQCYLKLPFPDLAEAQWRLQDLMSQTWYDRNGNNLRSEGLYLDMKEWQYHIFELRNLQND